MSGVRRPIHRLRKASASIEPLERRQLFAAGLDTTFNGTGYNVLVDGFSDAITAVHALPDGKVLAAGTGRGAGFGVTRYTSDGVIDTSFGTNGRGDVSGFTAIVEMLVRPDGQIVIVGNASAGRDLRVMQLTADGTVDTTFGVDGARTLAMAADSNEDVSGATLDAAGRIVAVGSVRQGTSSTGTWGGYVARFTAAGAIDTTFNGTGTRKFEYGGGDFAYTESLDAVVVLDGGGGGSGSSSSRIVAGGYVRLGSGSYQPTLVAYTDAGAVDSAFGTSGVRLLPFGGGSTFVGVGTLEPRGSGFLASVSPTVVALNNDGTTDGTFGAGGTGQYTASVGVADVQTRAGDGAIFTAGGASGNFAVMRLSPSGTPDASFGAQGVFTFDTGLPGEGASALSLTGDGRLVVGGRAYGPANNDRWGTAVARITDIDTVPAWLAPGSAARWDAGTKALTLTGAATITGDPAADQPVVNAAGSGAALTISSPGTVALASLNLSNGASAALSAGGSRTLVVGTLSITSGAQLDLATHAMVVRSGGVSGVQASVSAGFNGGAWNGKGIFSSSAASDPGATTAIGFAGNAELGRTTFAGVSGVTPNDVLVRHTYYGDADLSGAVTLDDFTLFLNGYQNAGGTWFRGDFDYNGVVTLDDFTLFLAGYQRQGPPL
jgi:uncharacterized delta-60 repeat protein